MAFIIPYAIINTVNLEIFARVLFSRNLIAYANHLLGKTIYNSRVETLRYEDTKCGTSH